MPSGRPPSSDESDPKEDKQKERHQQENPMILAEGPQVTKVTDMSHDDSKLEAIVRDTLGHDVKLDQQWKVCKELEKAEPSIRALLVRQDCEWGAVRVDSDPVSNVVTGQGNDFYIVFVESGQTCRFYRKPSVRYFQLL